MRVWRIVTKRSGQRLPRVEVEEMGPRIDFRLGRVREADEGMMKEALKRAKGTEARSKKNIETDIVGDKMGRIHLGRQDLDELQTRKMKGLKRSRDVVEDANGDTRDQEEEEEGDDGTDEDDDMEGVEFIDENGESEDDDNGEGVDVKRPRLE